MLACADEERHAAPAPGLEVDLHGGEGFHPRVLGDPVLSPIALVLAAHQAFAGERPDRPEHFRFLVAQRVGRVTYRRLQGEHRHDLQHVVLHHVTKRAHFLVEAPASFDAEFLSHGDLHVRHVGAVPQRLEKRVGEAEVEQVLHRLLAEIVIDAEDRALVEDAVQGLVERACRGEIAAKRLFHYHARCGRAVQPGEALDDGREHARRDGEVMQRPLRTAERLADPLEGCLVAVVSVDVAQETTQLGGDLVVRQPVRLQAVAHSIAQALEVPVVSSHADDRNVEAAAAHERLERRKDLLVSQVSGGAKQHQGVRIRVRHSGVHSPSVQAAT